jgi:hypothetical protein
VLINSVLSSFSGTNESREDELALRMVTDLPGMLARYHGLKNEDWADFDKSFGATTPVMRRFVDYYLRVDTTGTDVPPLLPRQQTLAFSALVVTERKSLVTRARAALFRAAQPFTSTLVIKPNYRG